MLGDITTVPGYYPLSIQSITLVNLTRSPGQINQTIVGKWLKITRNLTRNIKLTEIGVISWLSRKIVTRVVLECTGDRTYLASGLLFQWEDEKIPLLVYYRSPTLRRLHHGTDGLIIYDQQQQQLQIEMKKIKIT